MDEFRKSQVKIRPAVETLLEKAREAALGKGDYATYEDIFGTEKNYGIDDFNPYADIMIYGRIS